MGELRVRGDSSISHSSNGKCNGSNGYKNGTSHSSSGKNGERKARRRQRVQAKKRNKARRLILGMYVSACFVAGFLCINLIRGSTLKSTSAPQHGSLAASTGSASNGSGKGGIGAVNDGQNNNDSGDAINRILSEIPGNTPLTETLEQGILQAAQGELNQFPNSIGTDENASNPTWETIEHPGDEALKVFNGHGPMHKKRKTAKELASILSGKQLRGGEAQNNGEKDSTESSSNNINGIEDGYMRVPKLWDPLPYQTIADEREKRNAVSSKDLPRDGVRRYLGNFGSRLMTPAEAKSIGSHVPDRNDSGNMLETIFVAIASYRDWQCSSTVESALLRAAHPERIRIAVVDQIRIGDDSPCSIPPGGPCEQSPDQATCKYQKQVDYFTVDAELSVGPVFARHLGHRLYRGEYFAMQSDAHVSFVVDWDNEIVAQWHSARNEMAVLSTYLSGIEGHIDSKTGQRTSKSRPIMCLSDFEGHGGFKHLRHGQQPEGVPSIHEPTLDPFWAAGFSFARGHFVVNIPYDQHLPWVFQGEEISIGLRGFSYGYDYYSPEKSVCYHFYGRKHVPMFWENTSVYSGSAIYGMNRLNNIIKMPSPSANGETTKWLQKDILKYGIGNVRSLQKFFDVFGIHVRQQKVERHLCRFVGRPMQSEFIPALRSNEMGLDYDKITKRFKDPAPHEK